MQCQKILLEELTSEAFLEKALENARQWCEKNLHSHLEGFNAGFDYSIFHYIRDYDMISDMRLGENKDGLIRVNPGKLEWYYKRESYFEEMGMRRSAFIDGKAARIIGGVEVDPESIFVHEIAEYIMNKVPEVLLNYLPKFEFPHIIAHKIENINRLERRLKPWPGPD